MIMTRTGTTIQLLFIFQVNYTMLALLPIRFMYCVK